MNIYHNKYQSVSIFTVLINKWTLSETPLLLQGAGSSAQSVISKQLNHSEL